MQKIRGNTQIRSGTVPYSAVDADFAYNLNGTRSVTDWVQQDDFAVTGGSGVNSIDITTALTGQPITFTNLITPPTIPTESDLGFITTDSASGTFNSKSRVIIRDAATEKPITVDGFEIYGYLVASGSTREVKLYNYNDITESVVDLPAEVTSVDFQLLRRFTFNLVDEDFGSNQKFSLGLTDVSTTLNLKQLAQDIYGSGWSLDADGNPELSTSLSDELDNIENSVGLNLDGTWLAISGSHFLNSSFSIKDALNKLDTALYTHENLSSNAHAASAISFTSGSTGINATDVQSAIVALEAYSAAALQAHINANWDAANAHNATEVYVQSYISSGTFALTSGSLQTNLQSLMDKTFANNELLETHLTEFDAHGAYAIDVQISGSNLASHFPTLVGSGTVNLQDFLYYFDQHVHSSIVASSPDLTRIDGVLGIPSGSTTFDATGNFITGLTTVVAVTEELDTQIANILGYLGTDLEGVRNYNTQAASGSQLSVLNADSFELAIDKVRANVARHIGQTTGAHAATAISFTSGTSGISASDVQNAFYNVANRINRLESEMVYDEVLVIPTSGPGQVFTTGYSIKTGTVAFVLVNGSMQTNTTDFTFIGNQLTIIGNLETDDQLFIFYKRVVSDIV